MPTLELVGIGLFLFFSAIGGGICLWVLAGTIEPNVKDIENQEEDDRD